jgi:hypothetical protein
MREAIEGISAGAIIGCSLLQRRSFGSAAKLRSASSEHSMRSASTETGGFLTAFNAARKK